MRIFKQKLSWHYETIEYRAIGHCNKIRLNELHLSFENLIIMQNLPHFVPSVESWHAAAGDMQLIVPAKDTDGFQTLSVVKPRR